MKNIKSILSSTVLTILVVAGLTSCEDTNDWDVDKSYDRLFTTPKMGVAAEVTTANISWTSIPNAEYYVIEVSKDSLYDEIPMGTSNGSIVYGEDKSIVKSPYTISNLENSTKYFIRLKSMSTTIAESNWAYYENKSFKTKTEQILNEVSNVASTTATLTWEAGAAATRIEIITTSDGAIAQTITLTASDLAAGEMVLTGLLPQTAYRVDIYNNDALRGTRTFTTTEAFPDGYKIVYLSDNVDKDELLATLAAESGKVVIVFPVGSDVNSGGFTIPSTIESVIFWGAAGGDKKPGLLAKEIAAEGDIDLIKFYNMSLYNASNAGDYIINQATNVAIGTISFDNCEISTTRGIVRFQSGPTISADLIEINNCICTDIGTYGAVTASVATFVISEIRVTNSTFNTLSSRFIDLDKVTTGIAINVSNCTFYNAVSGNFIRATAVHSLSASNLVFGKGFGTIKGGTVAGVITSTNIYSAKDCVWHSEGTRDFAPTVMSTNSDAFFKDPTNGNFTIIDPFFTATAGDPRWLAE